MACLERATSRQHGKISWKRSRDHQLRRLRSAAGKAQTPTGQIALATRPKSMWRRTTRLSCIGPHCAALPRCPQAIIRVLTQFARRDP